MRTRLHTTVTTGCTAFSVQEHCDRPLIPRSRIPRAKLRGKHVLVFSALTPRREKYQDGFLSKFRAWNTRAGNQRRSQCSWTEKAMHPVVCDIVALTIGISLRGWVNEHEKRFSTNYSSLLCKTTMMPQFTAIAPAATSHPRRV